MSTDSTTVPIFVLAVDHRFDVFTEILGTSPVHPGAAEREAAASLQQLVFDGLLSALESRVPKSEAAIWTDSDLGEAILLRARGMSVGTFMSIERPRVVEFRFEDALGFTEALSRLSVTYAAARVPYNPGDDAQLNESQRRKLRRLSEICRTGGPRLALELMMEPTQLQLDQSAGVQAWETDVRPSLTLQTMHELQDSGVEPNLWVVEPPDDATALAAIAAQARVDDRPTGVLAAIGNDVERSDPELDERRVKLAARTAGVQGLVIGPSAYHAELTAHRRGDMSSEDAAAAIAANFARLYETFIQARSKSGVA